MYRYSCSALGIESERKVPEFSNRCPPVTECLARILFPGAPSSFLEHYRTRKYLHISRSSPNYYEDVLSDASLDELLRSDRMPPASVNVVKDGHKYSLDEWSRLAGSSKGDHRVLIPERLIALYLEGATLILNHAERTVLHRITPGTVVRRKPEIQAVVRKEGRSLTVDVAGASLAIPSFLESALDKIMSGEPFAIGDIEGFISTPGKVKLVSELVKSGLLRILNI